MVNKKKTRVISKKEKNSTQKPKVKKSEPLFTINWYKTFFLIIILAAIGVAVYFAVKEKEDDDLPIFPSTIDPDDPSTIDPDDPSTTFGPDDPSTTFGPDDPITFAPDGTTTFGPDGTTTFAPDGTTTIGPDGTTTTMGPDGTTTIGPDGTTTTMGPDGTTTISPDGTTTISPDGTTTTIGPDGTTTISPDGTTTISPDGTTTTIGPDGTTTFGPEETTTVDPSNDDLYKPNILTSSFKIKDAFDSFNETIQIKYYEKVNLSISQTPGGVVIDTKGSFDKSTLITTFQIHGKNYNKSIGTYHKDSDIIFDIIFENKLSLGPNKIPIEMERRSTLNIILLISEWVLFAIAFAIFIVSLTKLFNQDMNQMNSLIACLFIFIVFSIVPFALSTKYTMNSMGILGLSLCFVLLICWIVILVEFKKKMKKQKNETNPIRPNPITNYRGAPNTTYQQEKNAPVGYGNLVNSRQGQQKSSSSIPEDKYKSSAVRLNQFIKNPTDAMKNWRTIMRRPFRLNKN
jgi:hypothetical protein